MSRLDEIDEFLNHEACCDHALMGAEGCWDCLNTGHTHSQHIDPDDAKALVKFAKAVKGLLESGEDILEHSADLRSDFPHLVDALRTNLNELEQDV